ncbi:unnamed protein product [Lampetra planeri]
MYQGLDCSSVCPRTHAAAIVYKKKKWRKEPRGGFLVALPERAALHVARIRLGQMAARAAHGSARAACGC